MSDMIKQISICEVMDSIFPNFEDQIHLTWEEECKVVKDFCEKHNYMLYERVREEFIPLEGLYLAEKGGYSGVVYSDLS